MERRQQYCLVLGLLGLVLQAYPMMRSARVFRAVSPVLRMRFNHYHQLAAAMPMSEQILRHSAVQQLNAREENNMAKLERLKKVKTCMPEDASRVQSIVRELNDDVTFIRSEIARITGINNVL